MRAVLVADAHAAVRRAMHALLDVPDIEVVGEASTGSATLRRVRELRPDVLLMSVQITEPDALTVTRLVASEFPATAVILYSSLSEEGYRRPAREAGAAGWIRLDAPRREILNTIRTVGRGGVQCDDESPLE